MRCPALVVTLLCATACSSTPTAEEGPDLSTLNAAAPLATEQDCAASPEGQQVVRPTADNEPIVTFPALADWSTAESDSDIPFFAVTNGRSTFAVDVSSERAVSTSIGAQLDLAKAAVEHLPGWDRSEYRTATVCGHPSFTTVGTADLVLHTVIAVTAVVIDNGERLDIVTIRGQTTDPVDEAFLRDYPIMLSGLRITLPGA